MAILYAAEDTYNSRSKAADLVYADNFLSSSGGTSWHYAGRATPGGPPAQPGTVSTDGSGLSPLDYLNKVSDLQLQLDAANRKLAQLQWPLFAVWWDAVSDLNTSDPTRLAAYKAQVILLRGEIQALQTLISDPKTGLTTQINAIVYDRPMGHVVFLPLVKATEIPLPPFYQRKDPTICIAGMNSGWPFDYLYNVPVKFAQSFSNIERLAQRTVGVDVTPLTTATGLVSMDASIAVGIEDLLQHILGTTDQSAEMGFKK